MVKENISDELRGRQYWDRCFRKTEPDFKALGGRDFSSFITRFKQYDVKRALDLGCGFGYCSVALARAGFRIKAVDISTEAVEKLKAQATKEGLSIDTEVCAAHEINRINEEFDAVICNSVLDHMTLNDATKAVSNINILLRKGGIAYLSLDGPEEVTGEDSVFLEDGTVKYTHGRWKGMLWRFCSDAEIKEICKDFEIASFTTSEDGEREIWIRKG